MSLEAGDEGDEGAFTPEDGSQLAYRLPQYAAKCMRVRQGATPNATDTCAPIPSLISPPAEPSPPPPSPPPPPPPPVLLEGDSTDVASDVTFSALDVQQFDDRAFDAAFRTEFVTTVASSAGVEPYRVQITAISAGSVTVSFTVRFPLDAAASKETFIDTLATATDDVFEASATLRAYGSVQAVVFASPPPPPPSPSPSPPPAPASTASSAGDSRGACWGLIHTGVTRS